MNKYGLIVGFTLLIPIAHADVSVKAGPVEGHAPTVVDVQVANVTNTGAGAILNGDVLEGSYSFNDTDDDEENGTRYQWVYGNGAAITGATDKVYTVVKGDVGKSIKLTVTPSTDPAITQPFEGESYASPAMFVEGEYVPEDIFYGEITASGSTPGKCEAKGGRRLTLSELQGLYLTMTVAESVPGNNADVCTVWGWPLSGECGGTSYQSYGNYYYTDKYGEAVNMRTGAKFTVSAGQQGGSLVCKRVP